MNDLEESHTQLLQPNPGMPGSHQTLSFPGSHKDRPFHLPTNKPNPPRRRPKLQENALSQIYPPNKSHGRTQSR
jgi:hypothetical protein